MSRSQSKQISSDELRALINDAYDGDENERIAKLTEYGVLDEDVDYAGSINIELRLTNGAPSIKVVSEAIVGHILNLDMAGVSITQVCDDAYDGWEVC